MKYISTFKQRVPKRICRDPLGRSPMSSMEETLVSKIIRRQSIDVPYLMHGTMLGSKIIRTNTLLCVDHASESISFTRDAATAVHFSNLPHDWNDGFGTIFYLDRGHLNSKFKIEPFNDLGWPKPEFQGKNEMEELIYSRDVVNISKYCCRVVFIFWGMIASTNDWSEARRFALLLRDLVRIKRHYPGDQERELELIFQTLYLPMPIQVRLVAMIAGAKSA